MKLPWQLPFAWQGANTLFWHLPHKQLKINHQKRTNIPFVTWQVLKDLYYAFIPIKMTEIVWEDSCTFARVKRIFFKLPSAPKKKSRKYLCLHGSVQCLAQKLRSQRHTFFILKVQETMHGKGERPAWKRQYKERIKWQTYFRYLRSDTFLPQTDYKTQFTFWQTASQLSWTYPL